MSAGGPTYHEASGLKDCALRQLHRKSHVIGVSYPSSGAFLIVQEPPGNPQAGFSRQSSCWRHADDLPVNQLGLALHLIQNPSIVARMLMLMAYLLLGLSPIIHPSPGENMPSNTPYCSSHSRLWSGRKNNRGRLILASDTNHLRFKVVGKQISKFYNVSSTFNSSEALHFPPRRSGHLTLRQVYL